MTRKVSSISVSPVWGVIGFIAPSCHELHPDESLHNGHRSLRENRFTARGIIYTIRIYPYWALFLPLK